MKKLLGKVKFSIVWITKPPGNRRYLVRQIIDQRVLEALKKWKWSPALSLGTPVESIQRFRFNFEVQ